MDFAVPADHRIKLKECKRKDKYLWPCLKKLLDVKEMIVPTVIGAFGTITKGLLLLDFARGLKKTMEHEGNNCINPNWCFWNSNKRIITGTGGLGGWGTSGDHPNYNTIENNQNIEKSPGDLRKLALTQASVKDYHLKLIWNGLNE